MKVTIAQLNPIVGDLRGNLSRAKQLLAEHHGKSDLLVFSELFLTGYPPKDLLERPWFLHKAERALDEFIKYSADFPETGVIIGAPMPTGRNTGKGLANAAVFCCAGRLLFIQQKSLLPTYDVFDEARHFDPAPTLGTIDFKGETLGISICEDAWNDPACWPNRNIYDFDPITELAARGATLFINISASPFHVGKDELRFKLIRNHARKHRLPFLFVNQVGANDELIFDGGSMLLDPDGALIAMGPFFNEAVFTWETNTVGQSGLPSFPEAIASVYQALVLGIRDYLRKCGFKKAVIGLSGGIDSALTCALAVAALGKENVLGIAMPSPYSSPGSVTDSEQLAKNLGVEFRVVPIGALFQSYLDCLNPEFRGAAADVTEENIQARIRGNILMAFSNKFGYLALSTGNKSEQAVGYCTLYGDMSGGLSVISDVPKTMVYELAEYINRDGEVIPRAIITKAPSAELRPGQTDQDSLPPYEILDKILHYYIEEGYSVKDLTELGFSAEIVKWVAKTVDQSEFKRQQAAPGLKVTSKAFGMGRRMPIAKKLEY
jgi:NAD+ synthase (glutamine-hydrolysing)